MYFVPAKRGFNSEYIPVQAILYSYYIKYDNLRELTSEAFSGSDSDNLIVYIDCYDIIKSIYNRSLLGPDGLFESSSNILTSALLNLAAHLRSFYWSGYHVRTEFYLVFSEQPQGITINHYCHNEHLDKIIDINLKMLRTLCPYIPGIYLMERTWDSSIVTMTDIKQHRDAGIDTPVIIISKNDMMWQIPCQYENVAVFRPRKTSSGDTSFCVHQRNVVSVYRTQRRHMKTALEAFLVPGLLPLYMAMTSYSELDLPIYFSSSRAVSLITGMVRDNRILNGYNSPDAIEGILKEVSLKKDKMNLYERYKIMDLFYKANFYQTKPESTFTLKTQLSDVAGVESINNEYFTRNPIDIIHLFYS